MDFGAANTRPDNITITVDDPAAPVPIVDVQVNGGQRKGVRNLI
jgi:hypothetical protein